MTDVFEISVRSSESTSKVVEAGVHSWVPV